MTISVSLKNLIGFRRQLPVVDAHLLRLLLSIDLALIIVHCFAGVYFDKIPPILNIALDWSFAEIVSYGKWVAAVALLIVIYRRTGLPVYLGFATLFAVVTIDDSAQLHERIGATLANIYPGLITQDGGELIAFAGIAVFILPVLAITTLRSGKPGRSVAVCLTGLVAILAIFGIFVDALHLVLPRLPYLPQFLDLVEDGGEMITGSIIVAYLLARSDDIRNQVRTAGFLAALERNFGRNTISEK